jgi:hypothetical protein
VEDSGPDPKTKGRKGYNWGDGRAVAGAEENG